MDYKMKFTLLKMDVEGRLMGLEGFLKHLTEADNKYETVKQARGAVEHLKALSNKIKQLEEDESEG